MHKLIPHLLGLLASAALAVPPLPALRENEVVHVDPIARTVVIGAGDSAPKTYRLTEAAKIVVDDQPATLQDLAPGMIAVITATAPGVASRVAALRPKQAAPPVRVPLRTREVTVVATATRKNPMVIGGLRGGQLVTIVPKGGSWTAGGGKARPRCDWRGYPDERLGALPRMSLVAAVGPNIFLPAGDIFRFTVATEGPFYLFANDDDPAGNEGAIDVTVSIGWQ